MRSALTASLSPFRSYSSHSPLLHTLHTSGLYSCARQQHCLCREKPCYTGFIGLFVEPCNAHIQNKMKLEQLHCVSVVAKCRK